MIGIISVYSLSLVLPCVDNDAKIASIAEMKGYTAVSGCADVVLACPASGNTGVFVRQNCCVTCAEYGNEPPTSLPPADDNDPVQLFLLAGQSECTGQASAELLAVAGRDDYPELVTTQPGVWFSDGNVTTPMALGLNGWKRTFGPEMSFGQRIREVTGARVMIVKYCWGGSNVADEWNPATETNSWDRAEDDGSADWLETHSHVDYTNKKALFVNLVHTARKTTEALANAGVAYQWKSVVWLQGAADREDSWEIFGRNTARLFDAIRADAVGVWNLPIIDNGASTSFSLRTGKAHAGQLVKGCNVATIEWGSATEDPDSDCIITPTNPCQDANILSIDFFNTYGWDPLAAETPDGANDKTFRWFKAYPANLHSEDEGCILRGRSLANGYIRTFSDTALPDHIAATEPALLFPFDECPAGAKPTPESVCWIDLRPEPQASAECVPQIPVSR